MKYSTTWLTGLLLCFGAWFSPLAAQTQDKVGFVNLEAILAYMPETQAMGQSIQKLREDLGQRLNAKERYAASVMADFQEEAAGANEARIQEMRTELQRLDTEVRDFAANSEERIMRKRAELMQPILEKVQDAIAEIAEAEGYTFVLNSVDATSLSVVLTAPESSDLTMKVMAKLGIEIPEN